MIRRATRIVCNRYVALVAGTAAVVVAFFISGGVEPRPDLERLFRSGQAVEDQPPVVFVHGVLGAKLRDRDTGEEGWYQSAWKLLFDEYRHLALEIDPASLAVTDNRFEPYALAGDVIGKDFYGNIIRTLHRFGGYQPAQPGTPVEPSDKNFYVFLYDWRQDNVESAARLADFIDRIRLDYGQPDLKVDIVAHSMGGLITRYYLRYGREDVTDDNDFPVNLYGAERVRRVILLGTPSLGSVTMLNGFIGGIELGTRRIASETLATMPALYQLLPHPLNDWLVTSRGDPLDRDLFDAEIWRRFEWSVFDPEVRRRVLADFDDATAGATYLHTLERFFEARLERARRFVWSLTVPLPEPHPRLTVMGGDCHLTPARILVEEIDGESRVRMYPHEVVRPVAGIDYEALLLEPGDRTVTKASLLGRNALDPSVERHRYSFFPIDYPVFLCEEHNALTGNVSFQDNLLNALLLRD